MGKVRTDESVQISNFSRYWILALESWRSEQVGDRLGWGWADVAVPRSRSITPPETTGGRLQTALRFIYFGCRTYSSFPPHRSLPIMINFIDAYVVGFSALSFYLLKTYFEARAVWKQFRSVVPYSSRRLGRFTLDSFVTQHDSRATHTRQRIFDPW